MFHRFVLLAGTVLSTTAIAERAWACGIGGRGSGGTGTIGAPLGSLSTDSSAQISGRMPAGENPSTAGQTGYSIKTGTVIFGGVIIVLGALLGGGLGLLVAIGGAYVAYTGAKGWVNDKTADLAATVKSFSSDPSPGNSSPLPDMHMN